MMIRKMAGVIASWMCLSVYGAPASATQPDPPPQVCVNNHCVSTPSPGGPTAGFGTIKWNPGHYMASDGLMSAGRA